MSGVAVQPSRCGVRRGGVDGTDVCCFAAGHEGWHRGESGIEWPRRRRRPRGRRGRRGGSSNLAAVQAPASTRSRPAELAPRTAVKTAHVSSPETALAVMRVLQSTAVNRVARISQSDLAERLGISPQTARRALVRLEAEGRIEVFRKGTGRGYPTAWRIRT
ncbi:winged helix-turn-helix transcriptional regulator [Rhodococcus rhodochrous]|uniref:winged helix-turn-helix transcriptional regulator n=1 Tax=Rhodococcus rhodochrous TaxID=1829 RepID=UPI0036F2DCAC